MACTDTCEPEDLLRRKAKTPGDVLIGQDPLGKIAPCADHSGAFHDVRLRSGCNIVAGL